MLSFRKKLMSQSQENFLTDGRMEGGMDRHYFKGPFCVLLGVQLKELKKRNFRLKAIQEKAVDKTKPIQNNKKVC